MDSIPNSYVIITHNACREIGKLNLVVSTSHISDIWRVFIFLFFYPFFAIGPVKVQHREVYE